MELFKLYMYFYIPFKIAGKRGCCICTYLEQGIKKIIEDGGFEDLLYRFSTTFLHLFVNLRYKSSIHRNFIGFA